MTWGGSLDIDKVGGDAAGGLNDDQGVGRSGIQVQRTLGRGCQHADTEPQRFDGKGKWCRQIAAQAWRPGVKFSLHGADT